MKPVDCTSAFKPASAVTLLIGITIACGGGGTGGTNTGGTPTSPTPPSVPQAACRTYPTTLSGSEVLTTSGFVSRFNYAVTGSFNTGSATSTVTRTRTEVGGTCNGTAAFTGTYRSVSDFVDEGKTLGKQLVLNITSTVSFTGSCATPTSTTTTAYSYDGQGRLVRSVSSNSAGQATTTYTAWDSLGRPIQAAHSDGNSWTTSYNDSALTGTTITTGPGGSGGTAVSTYDSNNNLLSVVSTSTVPLLGAVTLTNTWTIGATAQVCR